MAWPGLVIEVEASYCYKWGLQPFAPLHSRDRMQDICDIHEKREECCMK